MQEQYKQKIEELKQQIEGLLPLNKKQKDLLNRKMMLEFNYNSNHIEGNTLTYGETKLLLMHGQVTGDHSLRDIQEMKAHDVALKKIEEFANEEERPLTEADIRELNKILLVEPFTQKTKTEEGVETTLTIIPGEYKKHPNHVRLQNGELLYFAEPGEVPQAMQDMVNWYRQAMNSNQHPMDVAAELHYKLVRIHPFADGNGRVARLIMNYHLIKNGFPPVIIKSDDKKQYLNALNKADSGFKEAFYDYVAQQLVWSLELKLKAAKGENIEDDEDIDKEIELFKKGIPKTDELVVQRDDQVTYNLYVNSFKPFMEQFINELSNAFAGLFNHTRVMGSINGIGRDGLTEIAEYFEIRGGTNVDQEKYEKSREVYKMTLDVRFEGYVNAGINTFSQEASIDFEFSDYSYEVKLQYGDSIKKLYTQSLTDDEVKSFIKQAKKIMLERIKESANRKP